MANGAVAKPFDADTGTATELLAAAAGLVVSVTIGSE
jgi:hypothetical protein